MSIKGGFVETSDGWLGSKTRIKILARDFLTDDDATGSGGPCTEEGSNTGGIQIANTSQELYCYIAIPTGYKVTECRINCVNAIQVRVWVCDINGSSGIEISDTVTTQYTNAVLPLTETASTDTNYIMIFCYTALTSQLIYGGYLTIEKI